MITVGIHVKSLRQKTLFERALFEDQNLYLMAKELLRDL